MRIETLGDGEPEVAVVGGIHGDEPCGPRAIEAILDEGPSLDRPVKFVVANEEALMRGRRYVEEDLNRAFPGDPEGETHESRLAHEMLNELRGLTVFSIHSTQSHGEPFALCDELDPLARSVVPHLSVEALVETARFSDGRLIEYPGVLEIEAGLQGSDEAAANAERLVREFLAAVGALPEEPRTHRDVPIYRMAQVVPKSPAERYEVFVDNFTRVDAGERYAAADGDALYAEEPFYPILMSPYGYENVFGFVGELVGRLDAETPAR
jgi:predicted deacylase